MTRRLRELALWTGALLGLLAVLAGLAVTFFGFSFLVFRSGSMSPEIPTGGLALSRTIQAADLHEGDVVSVIASSGDRVTHRIVGTTLRGDTASLILKGDANQTEDPEIYQVTSAERVVASVPYGGYVVAHALTPPGVVAAASLSLMLLVLGFGSPAEGGGAGYAPKRRRGDVDPRHRRTRVPSRIAVAGLAAVAVTTATIGIGGGVTGTWASFTDKATLSSGAFTAVSVPTPILTCTENNGALVTVSFPPQTTPSGLTYSATLNTGTNLTVSPAGNPRTITITQTQAPATASYIVTVRFTFTTAGNVAWTKTSTTSIRSTRGFLGLTPDITCE